MSASRWLLAGLFLSVIGSVFGYDWSTNPGTGSEANPYQISTPEHLLAINDIDTTGIRFVLTNTIDLDPALPGNCIFDSAVVEFIDGTFDGNDYSIENLIIQRLGPVVMIGLFGSVGEGGHVKNLRIENVSITDDGAHLVGALAGENLGIIINCHSSGTLGGGLQVGGLVGSNGKWNSFKGLIANSSSSCTITGEAPGNKGGLTAYNYSSIFQCSYSGSIDTTDYGFGGLIGDNSGVVNQCFSNAEISSGWGGGLIGVNSGIVRDSYAMGAISSDFSGDTAGLVAENYSYEINRFARIENCYAACQIGANALGLVRMWDPHGSTLSSFWDTEVSGTLESNGGKGLTTVQMKDPNTYIKAGWDLAGETANGADDIWRIDPTVNNGYPSLVFKPIDGGDGSAQNPYIIYTQQQLLNFFNDSAMWDKHVKLIANIDLSGTVFTSAPIGTFTGVFDGCGCTINGLTVHSASEGELGLIDVIGRGGQVKNLFIKNASMTDGDGGILAVLNLGQITDCHVEGILDGAFTCGGLVSVNDGWIARCSADCDVTDSSFTAGGLVGENSFLGIIRESCSSGSVGLSTYGGGLVAQNYGKIEHCYSEASVSGLGNAGALVGSNELGVIICCYAVGQVQDDKLVGTNCSGVIAHSYYGSVDWLEPWEGNSWYKEDGHIWTVDTIHQNYYYPRLKWQQWGIPVNSDIWGYWAPEYRRDPTRDGSAEHPYRFSFQLADYPADWDKHFVMTEDVDMERVGYPAFHEAVIPYFNGTLDGGGHVIKNLVMENVNNNYQAMGVFGMLGYDASVKRLGIEGEVNYCGYLPAVFAGINFGTLQECYAKGSVSCYNYGGVLTGFNGGTIRNCYAEGTLSLETENESEEIVGGGLYARSWGRVLNSYASVETISSHNNWSISGLGGLNEGLVWNSFWNIDLVDPGFILGGKPLTTNQLKDPDSFVGWGDTLWKIADGNDMPRLAWENTDWTPESGIDWEQWPPYIPIVDAARTYGGGDGSAQLPYVLSTGEHLLTLGRYPSDGDKNFVLDDDIDLSGQTLKEAVIGYFTGHLNGRGHRISGLTIASVECSAPYYCVCSSSVGLLGCIDTGGVVENLAIEDVNIWGMCTVGVLAGENNGTIRRSFATGQITARGNVGGLVGNNGYRRPYGSAQIEDCYTDMNVFGEEFGQGFAMKFLGGIAGANNGSILRCHAAGSINADNFNSVYAPFILGEIAGWSWGGIMQDCQDFAHWDFVGDDNGNQDIWRMCEAGGYPQLSWEFAQNGDFACPAGVGLDDVVALGENWLTYVNAGAETFNVACDANSDGVINLLDYSVLSSNWLANP